MEKLYSRSKLRRRIKIPAIYPWVYDLCTAVDRCHHLSERILRYVQQTKHPCIRNMDADRILLPVHDISRQPQKKQTINLTKQQTMRKEQIIPCVMPACKQGMICFFLFGDRR